MCNAMYYKMHQNPYFGRCYTQDLASGSLQRFPRLPSRLPTSAFIPLYAYGV